MDNKTKILLDKIGIDENSYQYFNDAVITKIKVNSKTNNWNIFITKTKLLPVKILEELESKKMLLDDKASSIEFVFQIEDPDMDEYLNYYRYLLTLLKDELRVLEIYEECMKLESGFLILVTSNETEKERLERCLPKITTFYKKMGYNFNIEVIVRREENVLEEIQDELNNIEIPTTVAAPKEVKQEEAPAEKKQFRREPKDENSVIGRGIKEDPIKIKTLIGEDNNVVVEGKVFGVEYFESSKTDFKIITLKITDYSDSIYCKVFVREDDEYKRLTDE